MACDVGGGASSSDSVQNAQSGFALLPQEIQNAYKQYGSQLSSLFKTDQSSAFAPTPITEGEKSAIASMYKGYTPTQSSISSDVAMQMNPYDEYVINEINRQSQGQNSALNSQLSAAGQFGSNRANLGANDIDLSLLNQIGTFKQNEYNTALQNALQTMPSLRQASDQAALSGGTYERDLAYKRAQAPYNALSSYGSMLGVLPTTGGSVSSGSSESSSAEGHI